MNKGAETSPNPPSQTVSPLEKAIWAFEQAWQSGSPPSIHDYLVECERNSLLALAQELALVDMEFRWRASSAGRRIADPLGGQPTWPVYLLQLPELGALSALEPALLAEEYRIRQLWGDQPGQAMFLTAYPDQAAGLPDWLAKVDAELAAERENVPSTTTLFRTVMPGNIDPTAPLPWSDYLLQEHLGSGGFGKVYRALQLSLGRSIAVKSLLKARQRDPQAVFQFVQEARLLARLKHRHIVGVQGLGRFPAGGYFLVLDFIDGHNVQQQLQNGPFSIPEALRISIAVAEAIQHAHEQGVIHADLKPSNILIDRHGAVFVTDFGLAHLLPEFESSTPVLSITGGTLAYLAPEIIRSQAAAVSVDIYGLGALLFALLTGQPPRTGTAEQVFQDLASGIPLSRPSLLRRDLSGQIEEIVMRCLETSPGDRYSSAAVLRDKLAEQFALLNSSPAR